MTVKVTERDDEHMSHEALGHGIHIWDVHQQDLLGRREICIFRYSCRG